MTDELTPPAPPAELPVWKRVLTLALPTLAQQGLLFFIQWYDQYLAKRYSPDHQAALTTANYLYWFVSSYSIVVSVGATALVGRFVGAGDWSLANRAAAQAMLLAVAFGLLGTTAALFGLPGLMHLLKLQDGSPDIAVRYLYPLAIILTLQMIQTGGTACLVGAGDTRTGLWVLTGVAAVNVPVAWVFSGGGDPARPDSFTGIALGTAVSHACGGLAVLAVLFRGRAGIRLSLARLIPDFALLYRLLRVSVPAAFDALSVACCQLFFLSIVNNLGKEEGAAHGIAIRWEALGYLAGGAFGPTVMAVVSQSLGQKRPDRAAHGVWAAFGMGCGVMCVMGVVLYAFARPMCEAMSPDNPHVAEMAASALRLIALAMPAVAVWIIFTAGLRAAGDTRFPAVITWVGFVGVRIPLALLLTRPAIDLGSLGTIPALDWGLIGAWVAMVTDLYVRAALFVWRFVAGPWRTIRV
jgi:putative MATE family efflux protein